MRKKKTTVPVSEKTGTEGTMAQRTLAPKHINLTGQKAIRLEIVSTKNGYVLRSGSTHQHHPTLTGLLRSIIEATHDTSETKPECPEKAVLAETTKKLIDYLFSYRFSPSQVVDVLHHLEQAIQHNIDAVKSTEHTIQRQLVREFIEKTIEFTEAQPFSTKLLIPQWVGNSVIRNHNGSTAIQRRGLGGITVFIKKSDIEMLMAQEKQKNYELLASAGIPEPKRTIILEFIEDLKDDRLGVFPMVKTATRIAHDAGEIDAGTFEKAGW